MLSQETTTEESAYEKLGFELVKAGVSMEDAARLAAEASKHESSFAVFGMLVMRGLGPHTARLAMAAAGMVAESPS